LILSNDAAHRKPLLKDIADTGGQTVKEMLNYDDVVLANTVARLYMEEDSIRDKGIKVLEEESDTSIRKLLEVSRVPITFALAFQLGDEDVEVQHKVSSNTLSECEVKLTLCSLSRRQKGRSSTSNELVSARQPLKFRSARHSRLQSSAFCPL